MAEHHVCGADCSWRQTPASLRALGYDMPELRPDYTIPDKIQHEARFNKLRHQAWVEGKTRLCTKIWPEQKQILANEEFTG